MSVTVRKAPDLDSYPPLRVRLGSALPTEVRRERCVCGGIIRQMAGDDPRDLVEAHNVTEAHEAWRVGWDR